MPGKSKISFDFLLSDDLENLTRDELSAILLLCVKRLKDVWLDKFVNDPLCVHIGYVQVVFCQWDRDKW